MPGSQFRYAIYIRTTADKLWGALTDPKTMPKYWYGFHAECDWKPGSQWKLVGSDGRVFDSGEVIAAEAPKAMVLKWKHELMPDMAAEGYSRAEIVLEPAGECVKLTVTHSMEVEESKFIAGVADGWPPILSSLKSLLETGESILETRSMPEGM